MAEMEITVNRELKSPNKWQGRHWRYKHKETQEWEQAIWVEIAQQRGVKSILGALQAMGVGETCEEKKLVVVTRLVPSARNFIKDDDNLRFATKPLNDALKRLKLIHDDSRKWLEQGIPTQEVSSDGQYYTRIRIRSGFAALRGSLPDEPGTSEDVEQAITEIR